MILVPWHDHFIWVMDRNFDKQEWNEMDYIAGNKFNQSQGTWF